LEFVSPTIPTCDGLLLPPDWEGYPLRKDFPLEFVENAWTERHLPEMTEVQDGAAATATRLRSRDFVSAAGTNDARHLSAAAKK
jgi:hypothetical protein